MKLSCVKKLLDAEVYTGEDENYLENNEVLTAFGSDLMSDVLAFVNNKVLLLTGLINPQVVRTAEMMDIPVICFVRGKNPPQEVVELAKDLGIVLMSTDYTMYVASGKLYEKGLGGEKLC